MRSPRSGPCCPAIRTRCSPRWARWRPPGRYLNGLPECGAVDLWKRCVDGGQAEGGAWGDRDRDRDRDRHRGGAGVGGGGVVFSDGWRAPRPPPPRRTSRHTHTRTRAQRQTRRLVIKSLADQTCFKCVRYPPPSLFKFVRYPPSLFKFVRYPPPPYSNLLGTAPPPYSNLLGTPPSLFKFVRYPPLPIQIC